MTDRVLSSTFLKSVFAQETDEVYIVLLTISHPTFDDDIRVSSDGYEVLPVAQVRGIVSRSEEFLYCPFNINLPTQDDTNIARASISVDNIDRKMVDAIRNADSAVSVTIEIILASEPDVPEVSAQDFQLEKVTYDAFTISGDISVGYYDLEPFPAGRFTPSGFPGAF